MCVFRKSLIHSTEILKTGRGRAALLKRCARNRTERLAVAKTLQVRRALVILHEDSMRKSSPRFRYRDG
jgi:hypothetical protein